MKRIISLGVALLMLLPSFPRVFAEGNTDSQLTEMFIPSVFVAMINREMSDVVNTVLASVDEQQREVIISSNQLHYVESSDTRIWYDNEDWLIELSAYFKDGNADSGGCADTLTFSFPVGGEYAALYSIVGASFSLLVNYYNKEIDYNQFCKYIDQCYHNYLETGTDAYEPIICDGYIIGILLYTQYDINRMAIALVRDSADETV